MQYLFEQGWRNPDAEMPVKSVWKQHIKYNLLPVESVDFVSTSVSMSSFFTSLFALETCFKTKQKPYENGKSLFRIRRLHAFLKRNSFKTTSLLKCVWSNFLFFASFFRFVCIDYEKRKEISWKVGKRTSYAFWSCKNLSERSSKIAPITCMQEKEWKGQEEWDEIRTNKKLRTFKLSY